MLLNAVEMKIKIISIRPRISLGIQWLRVHISIVEGMGLIPGQGTKIPHAMCSIAHSQNELSKTRPKFL